MNRPVPFSSSLNSYLAFSSGGASELRYDARPQTGSADSDTFSKENRYDIRENRDRS